MININKTSVSAYYNQKLRKKTDARWNTSVKTTRMKKVIRENEKRARKGAEVLPERSAKELFLHCNCASVSYMNSVNKLLRFAHRIPD
ncbi:hypothetical protein T4E_9855 [Trichinella pseudospiralis]|uniref:Uncharacterized protein n=1 Tax=Trichinella pseudospiralis TaxID=6337 RepID=A0A0V0YE46_TRIPS|nr:hypothetical protein T4E_9855 [Trichinella pseudospiralis]